MSRFSFCLPAVLLFIGALLLGGSSVHAQQVVEAEAFSGRPVGVGRAVLMVDSRLDLAAAHLSEGQGRAYFSIVEPQQRRARRVLRELVGAPQRVQVLFLFKGDEPLQLSFGGGQAFRLPTQHDPASHAGLLADWWEAYAAGENLPEDAPQLVRDFLVASLSRQLDLPMPAGSLDTAASDDLLHAARVLSGAESLRGLWLRRVASGQIDDGAPADRPLPAGVSFTLPVPKVAERAAIEPIANQVPPELFYARFGNFPNYLWFSHRMEDWGGEIGNLVQQRAIDYGLNNRQQEQLCLRETVLTEVLGPTVISDVALIGFDLYLREGAAMGILFEARNSPLLTNSIRGNRTEALRGDRTATDEKVTIAGKEVSFVSTPDNRLRSYYVIVDRYHLVTTSRHLVERFLQVAADGKSLGASAEFRHARQLFPIERDDAAFVYLSSPFLQGIISPRYQVELQRRQRSLAELDAVQVARVISLARGQTDGSLAALQRVGWLPENFGVRADGSRLEERDGVLVDSIRGPRGRFVPIPDVPLTAVTAAEARDCVAVAEQYAASWQQLTPIVAAVGRKPAAETGLEHVSLDVRMTPLAAAQYQFFAGRLGQASRQKMATFDGDAVAFDVILTGGELGGQPGGDYHLFGGLRNLDPRMVGGTRLEKLLGLIGGSEIVGYIGSWPRPGLLWLLGANARLPVDAAGYTQFITGGWRLLIDQFTLFSFQRELLAELVPQLKFIDVPRAAQGWIRAQDLRNSSLGPAANAWGFTKAVELSRGNAWFINQLISQLHVPPADALATAQGLLSARLVCPAGGKYELAQLADGQAIWHSTSVPQSGQPQMPPDNYLFPALYWLRGIEAELRLTQASLEVHADVTMPVKERARPALTLPSFSLPFGGRTASPAPAKSNVVEETLPPPKKPVGREF